MTLLHIVGAILLGCLGAALHLGITNLRARQVVKGRVLVVLATLPLAILLPALALFAAAQQGVGTLFVALGAFILVERVVLRRTRALP